MPRRAVIVVASAAGPKTITTTLDAIMSKTANAAHSDNESNRTHLTNSGEARRIPINERRSSMPHNKKITKAQPPAVVPDPPWLDLSVDLSDPSRFTIPVGWNNIIRRKEGLEQNIPQMIANENFERMIALIRYLPTCSKSGCDRNSTLLCDLCQMPFCPFDARGYRPNCGDLATPLRLCEDCKPVTRVWKFVLEDRLRESNKQIDRIEKSKAARHA